ncbi:MAG: PhnD/SsuA/transferrin family substrate-binding protein [Chloroflexi bacterium]|nr:PhnD/SsuA/transferrin family substrate-binding protein [Chloroflexota bacterium]
MKKLSLLVSLFVAVVMLLAACTPAPTPTAVMTEPPATEPPATEEPMAALGTMERPIKILFVPSVDNAAIVTGGELLHQALFDATGYYFTVSVPTSYAATVAELCASPDDTMAFIPGLGYALASQLCGVTVGAKAVRFGLDWYAAQVIVKRDSPYQTLADLNGLTWATPDLASTSGYLYPQYMYQQAGITIGETVEAGSHDAVVRAVYNGEVDFGTTFWSPANVDGVSLGVTLGADSLLQPDIPEELVPECLVTEDGKKILCGNYEVRDARRNIRAEAPDVVQQVRILAVTPAIPNDTLSFGPGFPADVKDAILAALFDFATNDPEGFAAAFQSYSWTSVLPATDAEYDPIRFAIQASGFSLENLP